MRRLAERGQAAHRLFMGGMMEGLEIIVYDLEESLKLQVGDDVTIEDDTDEFCSAQATIIAIDGTNATVKITGYDDADKHDSFIDGRDGFPIETYDVRCLKKIYWD